MTSAPKSPGRTFADQRIHVRAVHVEQRALGVQQVGDLVDLLLEDAERVGIGEHQRGDIFVHLRFERRDVDHAGGVRLQVLDRIAAHRGGRRIGSVRRIRHQNFLARVALRLEIGAHQQDSCHLAVRAGCRLQRDGIHAGDFDELVAEHLDDAQRALRNLLRLIGMRLRQVLSAARRFRSRARCTSWCTSPADTCRDPLRSSMSRCE